MLVTTRRGLVRPLALAGASLPLIRSVAWSAPAAAAPPARTAAGPASLDSAAAELQLVELINSLRADHGLPPLVADAVLSELAAERCADMALRGYFSHDIPGIGDATVWALGELPDAVEVAENLGRSNAPEGVLVAVLFDAWAASPGHRRNFLKPNFNRVGIGAAQVPGPGDTTTTIVAELFAESPVPLRRERPARAAQS